ncbi:LYR motif-containing protein 4 isoform X1 [Protopterus annectens]|uniref:LYR motif-containing protein 4 isoform X1 n=1 Tax=Protopterus annectens TaxID=7888 RepID=UPI001CF942C2|nr:LYR motif-containing protein 4 isoform X1 [Protopterus annectens]
MAASSRTQVLSLYRSMLKESKKFTSYSYRTFAIRRIRDAFRENKSCVDSSAVEAQIRKAQESLAVIQRQNTIALKFQQLHLEFFRDIVSTYGEKRSKDGK